MSESATITVTPTAQMADHLAEIAARERSTPDAVAAAAVADPLARGRADVAAGRIVPQAEVMRDVRATIDAARNRLPHRWPSP